MELARAKISQYQIKKIIKHFCVDIEASKAAYLIGINRNTVNRYYNLFRKVIYQQRSKELKQLIKGEVELDESYFGPTWIKGLATKRGRGTHRQPVFGIFERKGKVYTEIVPDCRRDTLRAVILGKIHPNSVIYSDGWRGYDGLVDVGYDRHFRINHKNNEFKKQKQIHINGIESFWSFTKRRLRKFNGVKINFHLHLKESEWRWNKTPDVLEKELWQILKSRK